ncbi:hypothetical protein HDU76_004261 [Blyttiomyces sp. JEL0837]|nr:hypothetical protein HDU76_004261 [Blyttiomyces sp. JEL0837]
MEDDYEYDDEVAIVPQTQRSEYELDSMVNARTSEVRNLLSRGALSQAIAKALEDPPVGRDPQSVKDKNTATVMEALAAVKAADVPTIVKQLNSSQLDLLMKFVYRGMSSPEVFNSGTLLLWHEKLCVNGNAVGVLESLEV